MLRSRTLASQILVAVLSILVITVSLGAILYVQFSARGLDRQYEQRALGVATTVAQMPTIQAALVAGDPGHLIQPLATRVQQSTGASYVVVIDRSGVRYSHPNAALIGQRIEEPVVALDGLGHVGIDNGSLGRSANGRAPLRNAAGAIIGEVSVGIPERQVSTQLRHEAWAIALYSALALALGALASWLLARRLKRVTFGLEPAEIASLLQEREAMLHGIREGVIGFDLAGDEAGHPPGLHEDAFRVARSLGLSLTIHAGEAAGPESVRQAIALGAVRLGHGVRAQEDAEVLAMVKDEGIQLDTAPTSNAQSKAVRRYEDHPVRKFFESGIKVTISTDSRTVSSITLTQEMTRVASVLGCSRSDIWAMNLQALDGGFGEPATRARLRIEFAQAEAKILA
jgi:hypothetical protein